MSEQDNRAIMRALEVMMFSTSEPISAYQMASLLSAENYVPAEGPLTPGKVDKLIDQMVLEWEGEGRPLTVLRVAGGYHMATRPVYAQLVARLQEDRRSQRLSRAALETLAIVAYKQPVIRPDIDAIRGVNSDSALRTLMERRLVAISGRDEGPGRPLLYRTTDEFLISFGLNTLADLPDPKELATLLGEAPAADAPPPGEQGEQAPVPPPGEESETADPVRNEEAT